MDGDSRSSMLPWIIAVILLLFAAYFAVAETAFASASRNKIKTAADKGDGRAEKALYILDHFDRAISTLLIGTNIVHIAAASLVTVAVTRLWGLSAVSLNGGDELQRRHRHDRGGGRGDRAPCPQRGKKEAR